jgi:hypothetical protein
MIRRHHYRCRCGHFEREHDECQVALTERGERPCGEVFHVHCTKCECWNFDFDQQYEDEQYAEAQERKYDEWKDRQMEDRDDDQD